MSVNRLNGKCYSSSFSVQDVSFCKTIRYKSIISEYGGMNNKLEYVNDKWFAYLADFYQVH